MNIFDSTIDLLETSLDFSDARNKVISNNISNIDTPDYKAKDVSFKSILNEQINGLKANQTNERHLPFSRESNKIHTFTKQNSTYNNNGNNVDVDKEMASLAKNQVYYHSLVDRLNGKFGNLQTVIRGGNG